VPFRTRARWLRALRGLTVDTLVLAAAGTRLSAQIPATVAPTRERVTLEVRPHAGDTVSVRLEHTVEMTGTRRMTDHDSTVRVSSSMLMLARTIVESVGPTGVVVVMRTDSVALESSDDHAPAMREDARRALRGATSRLRLLPDGTAESLDGAMGPEGASLLAVMPATLPRKPVQVGDRWTQSMPMPSAAGRSAGGEVRASFRLDSLTSAGRFAWISMKGTLNRSEPAAQGQQGPASERVGSMTGTLTGGLKLDRKRGWVVDSFTSMTVRSVVASPDQPGAPLRVTVRILQRMRAEDRP
jgi:hypothetical protein